MHFHGLRSQTHVTSPRERGQALIISVIFFSIIGAIATAALAATVFKEFTITRLYADSKISYALAEGALEDVAFRVRTGMDYEEFETFGSGVRTSSSTASTTDIGIDIIAEGNMRGAIRKVRARLTEGMGVAFHYGVQTDVGGLVMENSSTVSGNVFSNGPIIGSASGNTISGDVISAGPSGYIERINAPGNMYADTLHRVNAGGEVHYITSVTNYTAPGGVFIMSEHPATSSLPITDEMVQELKDYAASSTVISSPCPYVISADTVIGPARIQCDVVIDGAEVEFAGVVWIEGNLNVRGNSELHVHSSIGNMSVPVIVDNESNRLTSSQIILENNLDVFGAGSRSYVMTLSMNESAILGGSEVAIAQENFVTGKLLLYAGRGEIRISNNTSLNEVSGYRIRLVNSANVIYESGLRNALFSSGPASGFEFIGWSERFE